MQVRHWMSPDPETISPSATVAEARALLQRYGFHHFPIVVKDCLVGVVSDRDVARGVAPDADPVRSVMSTSPHVAHPYETVATAARTLLSRRINSLPVVDDAGSLVGMITTTDCLLAFLQQCADHTAREAA
jgi:CBS domain-containing protein